LEDEDLEEGESGELYNEDYVVDNDKGKESDGEKDDKEDADNNEEWDKAGEGANLDGDVTMSSARYGVSQNMLSTMEDKEEGW
jgi:hypothetical protein